LYGRLANTGENIVFFKENIKASQKYVVSNRSGA
jgi:hypothetical protein